MIEAGYGHKTNSRGSFYSGVRIKQFRMPYINPPSMVEDVNDAVENTDCILQ